MQGQSDLKGFLWGRVRGIFYIVPRLFRQSFLTIGRDFLSLVWQKFQLDFPSLAAVGAWLNPDFLLINYLLLMDSWAIHRLISNRGLRLHNLHVWRLIKCGHRLFDRTGFLGLYYLNKDGEYLIFTRWFWLEILFREGSQIARRIGFSKLVLCCEKHLILLNLLFEIWLKLEDWDS